MTASLKVSGVSKSFGGREVLKDVSFEVMAGESVALVGPSGSGKSTLLNIIGTLESPDQGSVELSGKVLNDMTGRERESHRNRSVGFLFQEHHLMPQLSALENVLLPGLDSPDKLESKARTLLNSFGLKERFNDFPATLSGGERQRVALCRALIMDPPLLLCDEPTGSLDLASGNDLIERLLDLARQEGKILLVVTHNPDQARRFGRTLRLLDGSLR